MKSSDTTTEIIIHDHEVWRLDKLVPYRNNAKVHGKRQVEKIVSNIRLSGFTNPLLIDEGGEIIAGHGRYLAAKSLSLQSLPVIVVRGLTEAQKRALRLADNRLAEDAKWDRAMLKLELEELSLDLADLTVTGFEMGEIDVLLAGADAMDDDDLPEPPPAVAELGDIWLMDGHRVACGDFRDADLRARLMNGAKADMAFLDPPYNVPIDGYACGKGKVKHAEFAMGCGELDRVQFTALLTTWLTGAAEVSRDGAIVFCCMDHHHAGELIEAGDKVFNKRLNIAVWKKTNPGMGSLYRSQHELVFVFKVGTAAHFNAVELGKHGRSRSNVWEYPSVNSFGSRAQELEMHPTVKPVALVIDAIKDVSRRGEIVLDGFLGSGTTLIAAERSGRVCHGCEIAPNYVDLILDRWTRLTGQEPVLEETGETLTQARRRRQAEA